MASKAEDVAEVKTGTITGPTPAAKFHGYMLHRAQSSTVERGAEAMTNQVNAILSAETEEEIWNADQSGTVQGRDIPGVEIQVNSLDVVLSTREDITKGHGYYGQMECVCLGGPEDVLRRNGLVVGGEFILQTGAELFVSKVRAFEARDKLPIQGVVIAIPTASGNNVVKFGPIPQRTTTVK